MAEPSLLEMKNIHKRFPGVYALRGVSLSLLRGEVHALLGENGAGKSTLIKVLGGIYEKDEGEIIIDGEPHKMDSVEEARAAGVSIIHQELVLVPYLTVAENIFLGRETSHGPFVDRNRMVEETRQALTELGLDLSPTALVAELNLAQQQMVEIAKAVSFNARIIVMDEPTSSLSDKEVALLFQNIRKLKARGIGIIYISHRMSELKQIADRVTVLRDGEYVATRAISETANDELVALMVGRQLDHYYTRTYNPCKETVLSVKNLSGGRVRDVSFDLKQGEILGFAGLVGAGRSETMQLIFGLDAAASGSVLLQGTELAGRKAEEILRAGISLVPEDRKAEGIFPIMPIRFNITLKVLRDFIRGAHVDHRREQDITDRYMRELRVKAPNRETLIGSLSGGNQQKVIIGSWLASKPKVLILDEPTRGIDVGSKSEIYAMMNELVKNGMSIIMVSSELPEVLNMSDRIVVMREGCVSAILDHAEATQEIIMQNAVSI
ncbi:MAG: sugar ABC transporter ATP-binding protein [Candidatus Limiplasma sp.]|nr:sugar ABC transporter ATP-binding protein [Candidatus Limiplasma sp.]MEA5145534.1 sugar ABC transporter ATP-binding protein [Candidatus Limiplasma sp.]